MYEEVQVLTHSSIRIAGNQIIYFDCCFLCRGHYFKPCDQQRCVG